MNEMITVDADHEAKMFELAQRKAQIYAKSTLVPKEYQNNIGNVLIATNMASRMRADTMMVMQNLHVIHGRPGWSSQFLIACFNTCGRFSAIRYVFTGKPGTDDFGCHAECTELATGEVISGTCVTMRMAKDEGWASKAGSKWKTMPEQMMRYRAATFLIRTTAPEIGMGLLTADEIRDVEPVRTSGRITLQQLQEQAEQVAEEEEAVDYVQTVAGILDAEEV